MKQDKSDVGMPKLEAGMVFKVKSRPNWFLVLDHDKRLYASIQLVQNSANGIIEIVQVHEVRNDDNFAPDQITRIVYDTFGDTRAVNVAALRRLLRIDSIGDLQAEWRRSPSKVKMTVADVEAALGYGVEIVSD